jgi:hypothetical protein
MRSTERRESRQDCVSNLINVAFARFFERFRVQADWQSGASVEAINGAQAACLQDCESNLINLALTSFWTLSKSRQTGSAALRRSRFLLYSFH